MEYVIVITGSNWQDTPLHYEIIESINNGNFPPQMPYFSGEKMSYHYFVDFHTAILEKVYGFLPQLVPFLASVFALLRDMSDKKRIVLAGIVTGLVFPFHVFAFICGYVAFFFSVLLNL